MIGDVVVANLNARWLKRKGKYGCWGVHRVCQAHARIMCSHSAEQTHRQLDAWHAQEPIGRIFVIGGDATCGSVVDWIQQDRERRMYIRLVPVGGGMQNNLPKHLGFKGRPLKHLRRIFAGKLPLRDVEWQPLRLQTDDGFDRHGILVANGVVHRFVEWYDSLGKGGTLVVVGLVLLLALRGLASITLPFLFRGHDRFLSPTPGRLSVQGKAYTDDPHLGILLSTVPGMSAGFRPFVGKPSYRQFYSLSYHGPLWAIIAGIWFLWFGVVPVWMRRWTHNAPVKSFEVETEDLRFILDGDPLRLSGPDKPASGKRRRVRITAGLAVRLLSASS